MNPPSSLLRFGIIGCGDFLRLQAENLRRSQGVAVTALYDPDSARAGKFAASFAGASLAVSAEALIGDPVVDVVAIFVPPWARKALVLQAARAGKPVITTKPLAPAIGDCEEMLRAVFAAGVTCGVIYNRTEDARVETLKRVLDSGHFGRLALFKQDWLHHYPAWNTWALDPERNGGPFMDAMIHNLNIARHLMGAPATGATLFSDRHAHPDLRCADTEFLKIDFGPGRAAHLFITWAADLAVYDTSGNHREHVDIWYAVTDQGWRITGENREGKSVLVFSKEGRAEVVPVEPINETPYERLARAVREKRSLDGILPSIEEAAEDIRIIRRAGATAGAPVAL